MRSVTPRERVRGIKGLRRSCGCPFTLTRPARSSDRKPTDAHIEPTAEELNLIRVQLESVERMLNAIFGEAYSRGQASTKARNAAADVVERHFEGIIEQWGDAVAEISQSKGASLTEPDLCEHECTEHGRWSHSMVTDCAEAACWECIRRANLTNSLLRFVAHMRNPDDIATYVYLRRHCQEGMLSRFHPGQFNTIHIALKQIILNHVKSSLRHHERQEIVRNAVVAAIDERRLMVSQFYIESRERALRASEEKHRNSIDHAPDPMYEIDPDTLTIIGANAAAQIAYKYAEGHQDSPIGKRIDELVTPELRDETLKHYNEALRVGSAKAQDMPLGAYFFDVHSAIVPFGNKRFIQTILHDVTDRREMMTGLINAEKLAATGTFAAGVAHEVNNPLASISSLVQSLVGDESDPERRQKLHTILSQITRISTTLKDLSNFARPSAAQRKALNLNELVTDTLRLISYNKRFNGITIAPELDPGLKAVFADPNEIQQVLINLLFNAADAICAESGAIRIVTQNYNGTNGKGDAKVVLRVIDNGIGVPKEHLEKVFEPFFTTKPAGSGVGLGLSLCQRIILANRGKIRVDSEVGKGTTVLIGLPVYSEGEEKAFNALKNVVISAPAASQGSAR